MPMTPVFVAFGDKGNVDSISRIMRRYERADFVQGYPLTD